MTAIDFLSQIDPICKTQLDRAIALLWFAGREDASVGMTAKEIADTLHSAGHPRQNTSRLNEALRKDHRTARSNTSGWMLHPKSRRELESEYSQHTGPRPLPVSDSMLPMSLLKGTRGYIERVGDQINKSFDGGLYDCCAVMCRRLLETLIIEVYEGQGRAADIRTGNQFLSLNELVGQLESDQRFFVSNLGMRALKDFKRLGDLSAHNRRYNARLSDLAPLRGGIRLVTEELIHLAGLGSSLDSAVAA